MQGGTLSVALRSGETAWHSPACDGEESSAGPGFSVVTACSAVPPTERGRDQWGQSGAEVGHVGFERPALQVEASGPESVPAVVGSYCRQILVSVGAPSEENVGGKSRWTAGPWRTPTVTELASTDL